MDRTTGSILLISGICIGSGMIAMPILLSKIGIVASVAVIIAIWLLTFLSSLVTVELNIKAKQPMSIGELGMKYSGIGSSILGNILLKALSLALLAVYISGLSSIIQKMAFQNSSFAAISIITSFVSALILLMPMKIIDAINRLMMIFMILGLFILLCGLTSQINWSNLPLNISDIMSFSHLSLIIPVIFTSFGFQGSLHSIIRYTGLDAQNIRKAIFFGTAIPALVYIIWAVSSISIIFDKDISFYNSMANGSIEVGDFIKKLSTISDFKILEITISWLSIVGIATSLIGVGFGLTDSLKVLLPNVYSETVKHVAAVLISVIPSLFLAIFIPNAFITILGFAGMILTVLAIVLPLYLFKKAAIKDSSFKELNTKHVWWLLMCFGLLIIMFELLNMFVL